MDPHLQTDFDIAELYQGLDRQREARRLSWPGVARDIWDQSAVLNAQRDDHPISTSVLTGMPKRMNTTCQHALFMPRWLGRAPESFIPGLIADTAVYALPSSGPDKRLRWNLKQLYEAMDARRREEKRSWPELARQLRCTARQLTGVRTASYVINMKLAMRIVRWLGRSARDFIYAAAW